MKFNYLISFLKHIINNNPIKLIFILVALIVIIFLTSFDDSISEYNILSKTKINNIDYYAYYYKYDDQLKLIKENENCVVKNNTLYIYEYNIINILSYIFSILTFLIILIISVTNDEEWDYYESKHKAFKSLIRCEVEDGKFYYFIGKRLIQIENNQIYRYNISNFSELKNCPIYYTKQKLRNDRLNNLKI